MQLAGFADEAGSDLQAQIRALRALGWHHLEARNVGCQNLTLISDAEFDHACDELDGAGIEVCCFGSGVANWAKRLTDPPDSSYDEMRRAVPRMHRLGTRLIRIMSFALPGPLPLDDREAEAEALGRLREIVKIAEDGGVICVHENCTGWAGQSWEHTLRLLDAIPSPSLRLAFDTGNPFHERDVRGEPPYPFQDAWDFYRNVREHVVHVHIKDGRRERERMVHTLPGEGICRVPEILADLCARGYDGFISIEPHLDVQAHDPSVVSEAALRYDDFVAYGRRTAELVRKAGFEV